MGEKQGPWISGRRLVALLLVAVVVLFFLTWGAVRWVERDLDDGPGPGEREREEERGDV